MDHPKPLNLNNKLLAFAFGFCFFPKFFYLNSQIWEKQSPRPLTTLAMEQWKPGDYSAHSAPSSSHLLSVPTSHSDSRQKTDVEVDPVAARKVQKADREKLRRDRLNEHFLELGNTLDHDRPKNDKATILTDSIQMLKDLTAEVNKLKAEYASLSEESREGSISFHPSSQPFPFFGAQNPVAIPNPCSNFIQYPTPAYLPVEQPTSQYASTSHISSKQDSRSKSSDQRKGSNAERGDGSTDVATDLELKMPGSSTQQDSSCGVSRKGKQSQRKERTTTNGSSTSRYSSQVHQDSSSNSVGDVRKSNN
ncbi:transcription factor bHLH121-like isoform X2 [Humulus lupulus]|uniref:transcription factor bHLH121-like isoform X2 n=1 Tax=Humulus lupulus TaxID=3486 RepID=UPI002B401588|nr:transcription factor bHLH121-like isoform X2 [Humulus lupulus]